jgi:hypothetical protein
MNFGSLHYFLKIKTNGKMFKTSDTILGRNLAQSYSTRHGSLPHEASLKVGWASAWRLSPAAEVARVPARMHARRVR